MLRVFKNRVLRRIFGTEGEEATECWRELHKGELHEMHGSPNMTTVITGKKEKCVGQVACTGENRTVYTVLVEKSEGKRTPGRSWIKW